MKKQNSTTAAFFLAVVFLALGSASISQWIPESRRNVLKKYGSENQVSNNEANKDSGGKGSRSEAVADRKPGDTSEEEKGQPESRVSRKSSGKIREPETIALKAGKADLSILMALHPGMALFSPGRGRFCRALPEGIDHMGAQSELEKRQQKVTANQKVYGKDLTGLEQELSSLERQRFGARAEMSAEINRAAERFRKNLAGPARIATAILNTRNQNESRESPNPEQAGPDREAAKEAYELELSEIETRNAAIVSRLERQIAEKFTEISDMRDRIEKPLYETEAESAVLMERIISDISTHVDAVAAEHGLILVINDSFGTEKRHAPGMVQNESLSVEFKAAGYPDAACNHYLEALVKPSPSKDPSVKNVRFQEDVLVTRIRDHLFSSEKVAEFYRSYFSPRFAWGNLMDLTDEVLERLLNTAGYDDEKIRLIKKGYQNHMKFKK